MLHNYAFKLIRTLLPNCSTLLALMLWAVPVAYAAPVEPSAASYRLIPSSITASLPIGSKQSFDIQFQALANLSNISLRLSNSNHASYVTISPATLGTLPTGSIKVVKVTLSLPPGILYKDPIIGTIDVFSGATLLPDKLSFTITLKSTNDILGPDANGNGIRDDIDRYISQNFKDSKERAAATQYALAFQNTLNDSSNKEASLKNGSRLLSAINCASSLSPPAKDKIRAIGPLILNTKLRSLAYLQFNGQVSGGYFTGQVGNNLAKACIR